MTHRKLHRSFLDSMLRAIYRAPHERWLARAAGALSAFTPVLALANPTGGQVVAGSATIGTAGSNGVIVDQSSQRAAINWQQFSIGSNEYVQFVQPNSSSVVLNRVTGSNPSSIFGSIRANGQVFLINPNGILFAPGSSLDVSGLTASTLDISNFNFMAGRYVFAKGSGAPDASVINQGAISVSQGGYVVLAGDYVENDGTIQARTGRVVLASGSGVRLSLDRGDLISYQVDAPTLARLAGVDNAGSITAIGGTVVMTADVANALTATAVNNSGLITAHSVSQHGGEILLLAKGGDIENSGTLDAQGGQGGIKGGMVVVHGNGKTELTSASKILTAGDNAKGGFIDLSGHDLAVHGKVTAGRGGSLLLDPTTLNIISGGGNGAGTNTNSVGTGFIASKLNAGSNVTLVASGTIKNVGTGNVINATSGANAGNSRFQIATGTLGSCAVNGVCVGVSSFPPITHTAGNINLTGLTINIKGQFVASASHGAVTVDAITANNGIFIRGGQIHVNGNLTAVNGQLSIGANGGTSPGAFIKTAGGVKLKGSFVGLTMSGSYGGVISAGSIIAGSSANVRLNYSRLFSPTSPEKVTVGAVTASHINISLSGPKGQITTGALTAVNTSGAAEVFVIDAANSGSAAINVNGPVTVTGKPHGSQREDDLPVGAELSLVSRGSASTAAAVHSVTVHGKIQVTANPAAFSFNSGNESGPVASRPVHGTGGLAGVLIAAGGSHGQVSAGSLNLKGPDARLAVEADTVKVGNISVTGSGHTITRGLVLRGSASRSNSYASNNNAGQAVVFLGGNVSYGGSATNITAGNIAVSGKGIAEVRIAGSHVSAGNIGVTATAAKGTVKQKGNVLSLISACASTSNCDSASFYRGLVQTGLRNGAINGGRATISITGNQGARGSSNNGPDAVSIKTGTLSVTAPGEAAIDLSGKTIQTQAISAIATRGSEHGTASSVSGGNTFVHTFKLNGGEAEIHINSGNSGSNGSALLTQGGGPISIKGDITATGPAANVDVKGQSVTITGNVKLTASGGSLTSDTVFTAASSPGYHVHYVGPADVTGLNVQGGANGLVSIGGNVTLKGPGLVGIIIVGNTVKLHGLSASASAAETYSVLDTRISNTTTTFTAGSVAVIVDDVAGTKSAPAFTSAAVAGNVDVNAKTDIHMASRLNVTGSLAVHAGGNIFDSAGTVISRFNLVGNARPHANSHSGGGGPSNSAAKFLPDLAAQAKTVSMIAGGGIDLTGAVVTTPGVMALKAGKDIILSGVTLNTGTLAADAGSTIHNGGAIGTITTKALALVAGKDINLSSTQISVGSGVVTPAASNAALTAMLADATFAAAVASDPTLLGGLAAAGLSPAAPAPNAVFSAGNSLTLGNLSLTGTYLFMQANSISLLGKVTVPKGAVVQLAPNGVTGTTDAEGTGAAGATLNLNDNGVFNVFPDGITLVLGGAGQSGAVTLGNNGSFDIGSDNLIVDTVGTVTGLGNVISTGQVVSLASLINGVPPVTAGEIDPTSNTTTPNGDKKQGPGQNVGNVGGSGPSTITQDTGASSVCH